MNDTTTTEAQNAVTPDTTAGLDPALAALLTKSQREALQQKAERKAAREEADKKKAEAKKAAKTAAQTAKEAAKGATAAQKETRIKKCRTTLGRIAQTCETVETAAAGVLDAVVQADRSQLDAARTAAAASATAVTTATEAVPKLKKQRDDANTALSKSVQAFEAGLGAVAGGKDFVARQRCRTSAATAHAMVAAMTPEVLGHNQPLLDTLKAALADFDRTDAAWKTGRQTMRRANASHRVAHRKLALAVFMLDLAMKRAAASAEFHSLGAQAE